MKESNNVSSNHIRNMLWLDPTNWSTTAEVASMNALANHFEIPLLGLTGTRSRRSGMG
jgi:hypothetical protein